MSKTDINLLATSPVSHGKEKRLKEVRFIALAFILLVGLSAVIAFALNLSSPIEKVKAEENQVLSQITAQQDKAAKLSVVNERVTTVSQIYKKRADYVGTVNLILSKKTSDIDTTGLEMGDSAVIISVSSTSLLPLNNFLNSVIDSSKNNDKITSVFLDSLSINQTSSSYIMGVKVNLK